MNLLVLPLANKRGRPNAQIYIDLDYGIFIGLHVNHNDHTWEHHTEEPGAVPGKGTLHGADLAAVQLTHQLSDSQPSSTFFDTAQDPVLDHDTSRQPLQKSNIHNIMYGHSYVLDWNLNTEGKMFHSVSLAGNPH